MHAGWLRGVQATTRVAGYFGLDPREVYATWKERAVALWADMARMEQRDFVLLQAAAVLSPELVQKEEEQAAPEAAPRSQEEQIKTALERAEAIRGMIDSGSAESEKRKRVRRRASAGS